MVFWETERTDECLDINKWMPQTSGARGASAIYSHASQSLKVDCKPTTFDTNLNKTTIFEIVES